MHADVQKYNDAVKAAQATGNEEWRAAEEKINDSYEAYCEERRTQREVQRGIRESRNRQIEAAREALKASDDKLVAFIAGRPMDEYLDHAMIILEALPATREQLEELARANDWCGEWDKFVRMADRAGVLPDAVQRTDEYYAARDKVANCFGRGREANEWTKILDAAVAAEVKAALAAAEGDKQ